MSVSQFISLILVLFGIVDISVAQSTMTSRDSYRITLTQAAGFYNSIYCRQGCSENDNGPQTPMMSLQERDALRRYSMGEYETINQALRSDRLTMPQVAFVRVLDSALTKLPLVSNIQVYRGTTTKYVPLRVGQPPVAFREFLSTSLEREIAQSRFVDDRLMIINVKRGYEITSFSNAGQEKEVLLPRDSKFEVKSKQLEEIEMINEETGERSMKTIEVVHVDQVD